MEDKDVDKGKNKIMMIVIIALLVVLLIAIGVVAFTVFKFVKSGSEGPRAETNVESTGALKLSEIELIVLADPITANLRAGTDDVEHVIRTQIAIGVNIREEKTGAALVKMITEKEIVVTDTVLSVLRSKTYQEMKRPDAPDVVAEEIIEKLSLLFDTNLIVKVNFKEFYAT